MNATSLVGHGDNAHTSTGSVWMLISMIAFSLLIVAIAWSLIRAARDSHRAPPGTAIERHGHGSIDADEYQRVLRDIKSREL